MYLLYIHLSLISFFNILRMDFLFVFIFFFKKEIPLSKPLLLWNV